jgi:hypothetical protein
MLRAKLFTLFCFFLSVSACTTDETDNCTNEGISVLERIPLGCNITLTPTRLSLGNPGGEDDDPALILAKDNFYYLAYLADVSGNKEIWLTRSSDGINWSSPLQITDNVNEDIYPNLLQTADGTFHLLWQRLVPATGESHVFYRKTPDPLVWPAAESQVTSGLVDDTEPMLVASDPNEFLVYFVSAQRGISLPKSAYNRDIYSVRSENQGSTWTEPTIITLIEPKSDNVSDRFPRVIKIATNDFRLVFQRQATDNLFDPTGDLMLSSSTNGITWTVPTQITSDPSDSEFDLFPNFIFAPKLGQWTISWLTTHVNSTTGGIFNLPLNKSGQYPAAAIDLSSIIGISGWSTRIASPSSGKSLIVFVSSSTGKPQLWSVMAAL